MICYKPADFHLSVGRCFHEEEKCLGVTYDMSNITEVAGTRLDKIAPHSGNEVFLSLLKYPNKISMNCQELCKCLNCGYGYCSEKQDQDRCLPETNGFICECEKSSKFPTFEHIMKDMMVNQNACRSCNWSYEN